MLVMTARVYPIYSGYAVSFGKRFLNDLWAPPTMLPDEFNAAAYFIDRHINEGRSSRIAIECGERNVTYGQLFTLVNQFGNALRSFAVRMEERILLLLLDTPEFAVSFFGAIKIGAVPVPV